jgi:hypothetical protein
MFRIIILICSIQLSPADCQIDNATDVINGPEAYDSVGCGLYGQAYVAETALGERRRDDEYVKVSCQRTTIGKNVG